MSDTQLPLARHAARNALHTALLLAGMFALFAAFGWFLDGSWGVIWLGLLGAVSVALGARVSPTLVLRMYRARPLTPAQAPELHAMVRELAAAAELPAVPTPWYVPSTMINAFAVGTSRRAAIGITDGLLRSLSAREVRGVLAHEMTHVRNNDAWVMGLADFVTRTVNFLAWFGQLMLLITLPAVLLGMRAPLPLGLVLLMVVGPTLSALLQLALSRSREFDADVGAARLTGDPRALASALARMERLQAGVFERVFLPGRRVPEPSLLRTHPPTEERVQRLLEMEAELARTRPRHPETITLTGLPGAHSRPPRWHATNTWY